jgi:hypothetical protein
VVARRGLFLIRHGRRTQTGVLVHRIDPGVQEPARVERAEEAEKSIGEECSPSEVMVVTRALTVYSARWSRARWCCYGLRPRIPDH